MSFTAIWGTVRKQSTSPDFGNRGYYQLYSQYFLLYCFGYSFLRLLSFSAISLSEFYYSSLLVCVRQTHEIGTCPPEAMTKGIIRVQILKGWQYLLDKFLIDYRSLKQYFYLLFISYGFWFPYPFPKTLYPRLRFSLTSCDLGNGLKGGVIARRVPKIQTGETIWSNYHSLKLRFFPLKCFWAGICCLWSQWRVLLLTLLISQLVCVSTEWGWQKRICYYFYYYQN